LFPVLRTIDDPEVKAALNKVDALEHDHRWAEPLHQLVDALGEKCLAEGNLDENDARKFRDAVSQLQTMYARHILVEDNEVFPVAEKVLTAEQKSKIASEMAARRHVQV